MNDLDKLKDPNSWPLYPEMPMIRRVPNDLPETAVVIAIEDDGDGHLCIIEGANVFMQITPDQYVKDSKFLTPEEIVNDGWTID